MKFINGTLHFTDEDGEEYKIKGKFSYEFDAKKNKGIKKEITSKEELSEEEDKSIILQKDLCDAKSK